MTHATKRNLWPWTGRLAACVALAMLPAGCSDIPRSGFAGAVPVESVPRASSGRVAEKVPSEVPPETPVSGASPVQTASASDIPLSSDAGPSATPAQVQDNPEVVAAVATDATASAADAKSETPPPGKVEILIKERTFTREKSGELRVTYDDLDLLKVLNMARVTPDAPEKMPEWLKKLDGQPVRIRGFMYPTNFATGLTKFILTRDTGVCCFGPNAKIYDWVQVKLKPDMTTDYIQGRPFDVSGTFHIEVEEFDEGEVGGLYHIDAGTVIEK